MFFHLTVLTIGLFLLWIGAELLVKNTVRLARSQGISPIILGLTVVSIGTSMPELVVSSMAAMKNSTGIAIGNIIGSNIANLGLVLGVGAVLVTLPIKSSWLKREVPFMVLVTLIIFLFAWTGSVIERYEGLLLLGFFGLFILYIARFTLKEMAEYKALQNNGEDNNIPQISAFNKLLYLLLSILGIAILIWGSHLTVNSGTKLADLLGVSKSIIGLTLIALGTSLPELVTTIVSVVRKSGDIAIGNVIGSNIFNLTFVGGISSLIRPISLITEGKLLVFEFPLLIFLSVLIWPLMRYRWDIRRLEGAFLLTVYAVFIFLTILTK